MPSQDRFETPVGLKVFKPDILKWITPIVYPEVFIWALARVTRGCLKPIQNLSHSPSHAARKVARSKVQGLVKLGHLGVLEHVQVSALVRCSRACSHQWVRQRIGCGYLQESQRHVEPQGIIEPTNPNLSFVSLVKLKGAEERAFVSYYDLVRDGCAREDARRVLPQSTVTHFVVTGNLRAWRHFVETRATRQAQGEIQGLAVKARAELSVYCPSSMVGLHYVGDGV